MTCRAGKDPRDSASDDGLVQAPGGEATAGLTRADLPKSVDTSSLCVDYGVIEDDNALKEHRGRIIQLLVAYLAYQNSVLVQRMTALMTITVILGTVHKVHIKRVGCLSFMIQRSAVYEVKLATKGCLAELIAGSSVGPCCRGYLICCFQEATRKKDCL